MLHDPPGTLPKSNPMAYSNINREPTNLVPNSNTMVDGYNAAYSNDITTISAKKLLPYNVTPPRPMVSPLKY